MAGLNPKNSKIRAAPNGVNPTTIAGRSNKLKLKSHEVYVESRKIEQTALTNAR